MKTMKAVRIHAYGGPETLQYEDAPRPVPGAGEVLVRVHAAGVNPVDWKAREGYLKSMNYPLPLVLGWDLSGTVAELGAGVTSFAVGDAVYARPDIGRNGAYAEYVAVKASELAKKPVSLDHVQAAAVPLAALTAWQALFEARAPYSSANLKAGQTVLVHAGAGGVGTFAIQLAKWKGARVIATGSAKNARFLSELGADQVVDYTAGRFEDAIREPVDVVFDTVGGETLARSWSVVKKGGVVVSIVSRPSEEDAQRHGARAAYVFVQPHAEQLAVIGKLIDQKTIGPVVAEVLPLADARVAHEKSKAGHVRGKIVLRVVEA
jgi:NADPH:quinone reductase-like Zn-dependent oxidoreductase